MARCSFQILDFLPSGCCILGQGGKIVFWNKTLEGWTGKSRGELVDQNVFEAFPNLGQARFRERILSVLETGAPTFFSSALNPEFFPSQRAAGRPRIQQTALNRLETELSEPLVLITVSDVTDQHERGEKYRAARAKAIEEARIRSEREAQYRLVVGLSKAAILICDPDGRIQDCNPSAMRIFRTEDSGLIGSTLQSLFSQQEAPTLQRLLSAEMPAGEPNLELEGLRRDASPFPAELTLERLQLEGRRQCVAYIHDHTQRKQAEEALRHAQKQESLGVLAGGIAHDFNNLFGGVLATLDLAEARMQPNAPDRVPLERIRGEILRAADLSRQMLAFSGKGRFALTILSLDQQIKDYGPELSHEVPSPIILRSHLNAEATRIEADPSQLRQLIEALVTNAVEAIHDEGSIDVYTDIQDLDQETLRHTCPGQPLTPGRYVTLEVVDSGCGISPENLPRIFDPFFSTKFAGRGLSLAVALGILRGHRAGFSISSALGVGTRFKIFFPAQTEAAAPAPIEPMGQQRTGRILVVDDEPVLRETVRELLESLGYDVDTACDGVEAVDSYQRNPSTYALVIMDLTMPHMDGLEAFRRIRTLDPQANIILSSGFSEQNAIQRFQDLGISAFLPKPYRVSQLETAIAPFVKLP